MSAVADANKGTATIAPFMDVEVASTAQSRGEKFRTEYVEK
jgi:hypothetical protein